MAVLPPGTQWSQRARLRLPAAPAVRTNGAASSDAVAAVVVPTKCRRDILRLTISYLPKAGIATRARRPAAWPLLLPRNASRDAWLAPGPQRRRAPACFAAPAAGISANRHGRTAAGAPH